MITVKPHIERMSPYAPPWSNMDRSTYLRFDLNEYTLTPPEVVTEALIRYISSGLIPLYPDYHAFMPKLARYTGIPVDQLLLTNGSDQAIEIILRAFLEKGDEVVMAEPGFPIFNQVAGSIGATIKGIPYQADLTFPEDDFMAAISANTTLIVLINPDNPTGSCVPLTTVERIVSSFPNIPVLLDEAYYEFTGVSGQAMLDKYPNLMITRTFSKAFAMAGLRMGYILAHKELIGHFNKIRGPFDVNVCALIAGDAQIDHPETAQAYIKEVMTVSKPFIEQFFAEQRVTYFKGAAHFMLVKPKSRDQAVLFLKENGILVRPMVAPLIQDTFRMSLGTLEQTRLFAEVYERYLQNHEYAGKR